MAGRSGQNFGNFNQQADFEPESIKPIRSEFSQGSVPNSLYAVDREASWTRWRRGYELATATGINNDYEYPFTYKIPLPQGVSQSGTNPPTIPGVFKGYPTVSKDCRMHWAGLRLAGSLRFDNIRNTRTTNPFYWHGAQFNNYENIGQWFDPQFFITNSFASIESVTEDDDFWYVKLTGPWSTNNPLPPPLYVPIPGVPGGIKAINGEILEDRIITQNGVPITRDTIDPTTQKRYGYVQAVLVDTNPFTGVLTLRKRGSVEATPDRSLVTPATRPPNVGRFLMTGTRYCCSCQDFTRREYMYLSTLKEGNRRCFPRNNIASVKPGRKEIITFSGFVNNNFMTSATENRDMSIVSPGTQYNVPPTVTPTQTTVSGATRDNPGVYRDFGAVYLRDSNPAIPGAKTDGPTTYADYTTSNQELTSLTDNWTPLLDEFRYCKHIYAMKFKQGVFPPEPSDMPIDREGLNATSELIIQENKKNQDRISYELARDALTYMDVPPYNCQSPMMMPMMQKLFNIPSTYVRMQGFYMFDKEGNIYRPSDNEKPAT